MTRTAGQVARLLGVAESTLRAWHRRYGLGPAPARPGGYRRYADHDLARLQRMRDLVRGGVLPSDAARVVVGEPDHLDPSQSLPALLAAVRDLDGGRCLALLERVLAGSGVVAAWERLCRPAFAAVEADQSADAARGAAGGCVAGEHVLSWATSTALRRRTAEGSAHRGPAVLLACTDGEQHTLPVEALGAALVERGVPVRLLGPAVPAESLARAIDTTRPEAVVLWSQRRESARTGPPHHPALLLAGPGWTTADGAAPLSSLTHALERLT
ncbi:MerR family transcriptional regulator [Actinokineospora auranticolor]|uniref:MerR family transcriptional regulator n=1 Tax=Actinokineospora auranticolor TaxID=155976 RepID=UPI0015E41552|nr:MerR family transcriptional regulator [Actinokineospora auranticolor]